MSILAIFFRDWRWRVTAVKKTVVTVTALRLRWRWQKILSAVTVKQKNFHGDGDGETKKISRWRRRWRWSSFLSYSAWLMKYGNDKVKNFTQSPETSPRYLIFVKYHCVSGRKWKTQNIFAFIKSSTILILAKNSLNFQKTSWGLRPPDPLKNFLVDSPPPQTAHNILFKIAIGFVISHVHTLPKTFLDWHPNFKTLFLKKGMLIFFILYLCLKKCHGYIKKWTCGSGKLSLVIG